MKETRSILKLPGLRDAATQDGASNHADDKGGGPRTLFGPDLPLAEPP